MFTDIEPKEWVVAEGVEKEQLKNLLAALGCRYTQGYYFDVPLRAEDTFYLLQNFASESV